MKSKVQMGLQILVVHNGLIYFVNRQWIINHKTTFLKKTCIITLVSFSSWELHRGITTNSQLVTTGYSRTRKTHEQLEKQVIKTLLHMQFYNEASTYSYMMAKDTLFW